jgi:uncharacterized protein DUF4238
MSEPRKHHYVPQWHLRQWVSSDYKLQSFMRLEDGSLSSRRISPKSIAFEQDLYSWASQNHDNPQELEKEFFQKLDTTAAQAAEILREPGTTPMPMDLRSHWARFLTASILRLPLELQMIKSYSRDLYLDQVESMSATKVKQITQNEWAKFIDTFFPGYLSDLSLKSYIDFLQDHQSIDTWLRLQWWVEKVDNAQYSLLTSDKPLIMRGIQGMKEGFLAFMPLSPRRLFCATDDPLMAYLIVNGQSDFCVNWSNNLQIKMARKYLFAEDEKLQWHIEKFFGEGFPDPPLPERSA